MLILSKMTRKTGSHFLCKSTRAIDSFCYMDTLIHYMHNYMDTLIHFFHDLTLFSKESHPRGKIVPVRNLRALFHQ